MTPFTPPLLEQFFDIYSKDAEKVSNGKHVDVFACPLCLDLYPRSQLFTKPQSHISLAHIVPHCLGGSKNLATLLCRPCNNGAGGKNLESHLHNHYADRDWNIGIGDKKLKIAINSSIDERPVHGNVEKCGKNISIEIAEDRSNPSNIEHVKNIFQNQLSNLNFEMRFQFGSNHGLLYKAAYQLAYLLLFRHFGHRMLNPFNELRLWINDKSLTDGPSSVFEISDHPPLDGDQQLLCWIKQYNTFLAIFKFVTEGGSIYKIGVVLPYENSLNAPILPYSKTTLTLSPVSTIQPT